MPPTPTIHLAPLSDPRSSLRPWEALTPREQLAITKTIRGDCQPSHWVAPASVDDAGQILCQAAAERWQILASGSGSKLSWGGLVHHADLVLSSQNLRGILDHAAADLTVTVESGVKLADLQAFLTPHQQFLPLDPAYPDQATLGGIMATADAGSWRQRYGGVRDLVLGFSFLRWDGKVAKAGGKVVKNVAGYDLMKLFTGSFGTLGFITQLTLRLYPVPPVSRTLFLSGPADKMAISAQTLLSSGLTPTAADLLSPELVRVLGLGETLGLLVRFQNISESVQEQYQQLEQIASSLGLAQTSYQDDSEKTLWQRLQTEMTVLGSPAAVTCKLGVMPSQAVNLLEPLAGLGQIHLKSGLGRLAFPELSSINALQQQRILCQNYRGFLTVLEAPHSLKTQLDPWGYDGNGLELMRRLKQQFDPQQIFSPQRFVGGI